MQVLNEANLTNAVLVRSVLTRSDLGGAIIEGADFSDAVIDLLQKQVILVTASDATCLREMCLNAHGLDQPISPSLTSMLLDRLT